MLKGTINFVSAKLFDNFNTIYLLKTNTLTNNMKEIKKKEGVIVSSTALKTVMYSIEEEETIAEGFEMKDVTIEQFEDDSIAIIGVVTTDFTWTPNYVGDTIQNYSRYYNWEKFEILIVDYKDTRQVYNTIKVELYELMNIYGTNTKDKNGTTNN